MILIALDRMQVKNLFSHRLQLSEDINKFGAEKAQNVLVKKLSLKQ